MAAEGKYTCIYIYFKIRLQSAVLKSKSFYLRLFMSLQFTSFIFNVLLTVCL